MIKFMWQPQWAWDMLRDPIRRVHFAVQCGMVIGTVWGVSGSWRTALVATGVYFGIYEFLLEPLSKWMVTKGWPSLVGPYWERGPQDGEQFRYE